MIDHHDEESIARIRALKERVVALCATKASLPHARQRSYACAGNAFHRAEEELNERSKSLPWSTDYSVANAIYTHWLEVGEKARWWRVLCQEERQLLRWAVNEMQRRGLDKSSEMMLLQRVAADRQADAETLEAICLALNL